MEAICKKTRLAMAAGQMTPETTAHLKTCDGCQLAESTGPIPLGDVLQRDPSRYASPAPKTSNTRVFLFATGLATSIIAVAVLTRPDIAEVPPMFFGLIVGLGIASIGLITLATRPPFIPEPKPSLLYTVAAIGIAAVFAPVFWMESSFQIPAHVSEWFIHLRCFFVGFAVIIPFLILGLWRQTAPRNSLGTFLLFLSGAVLGNLVLLVHCPVSAVGHQLCGHTSLLPIAALAAGLLVFRKR